MSRILTISLLVVIGFSLPSAAKKVHLKDAHGKSVGTATIKSAGTGGEIKLSLKSLPPGEHAFHVHQNAQCDPPDFKAAGPHFNPDSKQHGLENPNGHHAGDMTNFTVNAKGHAKLNVLNKDVTLGNDSHS